jgi:glycosyltransferase 2 family protein
MRAVRGLARPRYLLWLAVFGLLLLAARGVAWQEVGSVLGRLGPAQILVLAGVNTLILVMLSGRWWLILAAQGYRIPFLRLLGYRLAGFGVSYFTPGPQFGGEPLQVYLVHRHHDVPREAAIAAVTLDKLLELLANFAFLVGGLACVMHCGVFGAAVGRLPLIVAGALLCLPVGFLAATWAGWRPAARLVDGLAGHVPWQRLPAGGRLEGRARRIQRLTVAGETEATLFMRRHPTTMLQALWVSLVVWAAMVGEYWLMLHFLGWSLPPAQTIGALTAARLAFLVPLPGGLGTLEASQVVALNALGLPLVAGVSLSLLIRARDIILGGLGLYIAATKS